MRSLIVRLRSVLYLVLLLLLFFYFGLSDAQRLQPPRQYFQSPQKSDDDVVPEVSDDDDDIADLNSTEPGMYLGSPCQFTCSPKLLHVFCDSNTGHCECDKKYPVKLSPSTGCGKPKKLGEQCLYRESCIFSDQHSSCIQLHHNAICQCLAGYHTVSLQRPTKRVFCAEDLELLTSDFSALAGVVTGIAVLGGLICFVLRLFTQARSPRPRHFANANLAPPILFSSDTGIPLTVHSSVGRSTSRASSQRTFVSTYSRRPSSAQACLQGSQGSQSYGYGSRGVLVSASRAGAARAAAILLISCHVTATTRATGAQSPELRPNNGLGDGDSDGDGDGDDVLDQDQAMSPDNNDDVYDDHDDDDDNDNDEHHSIFIYNKNGNNIATTTSNAVKLGSRRPSLASVHSSGSSVKSYSTRRFEREREEKEERQMQIKLAKMQQTMQNNKPPTPSPQSTDDLLPTVHRQVPYTNEVPLAIEEECASTSFQNDLLGPGTSKEFR